MTRSIERIWRYCMPRRSLFAMALFAGVGVTGTVDPAPTTTPPVGFAGVIAAPDDLFEPATNPLAPAATAKSADGATKPSTPTTRPGRVLYSAAKAPPKADRGTTAPRAARTTRSTCPSEMVAGSARSGVSRTI